MKDAQQLKDGAPGYLRSQAAVPRFMSAALQHSFYLRLRDVQHAGALRGPAPYPNTASTPFGTFTHFNRHWVSAVILYWSFSSISNLAIPSENQNLNILQEITRLTVSTLNLMFFQIFAAKVVLQYFNLCSIIFLIILMFQKH